MHNTIFNQLRKLFPRKSEALTLPESIAVPVPLATDEAQPIAAEPDAPVDGASESSTPDGAQPIAAEVIAAPSAHFAGQQVEFRSWNLDEALAMRRDGWSLRAIAQMFGKSKSFVHRELQEPAAPESIVPASSGPETGPHPYTVEPTPEPAVVIPPTPKPPIPVIDPLDDPNWVPDPAEEESLTLPPRSPSHIARLIALGETSQERNRRIANDKARYIFARGGSVFRADPQSAISHIIESSSVTQWVRR